MEWWQNPEEEPKFRRYLSLGQKKQTLPASTRIFLHLSRILVGVLFLISGLIKLNDLLGFSYKLEEYFHVFEQFFGLPYEVFGPHSLAIAALIATIETFLAVALLMGWFSSFTTSLLLAMIVFFTFLTGFAAITRSIHDCGCFGDALRLTPWQSFSKDVILLFLIGFLFLYRDAIQPLIPSFAVNTILVIATFFAIIFLGYYTYNHLPIIDFRPYHIGADLQYNTTHTDPKTGLIIARDYVPFSLECEDEFKGKVILIFSEDLAKIPDEVAKKMVALAKQWQQKGFKVMMGTASPSKVIEQFKQKYHPTFCIAGQDQTTVKTIVRSNPGFLYLENGIIKGKWHYNDMDEINTL